ncbi:peptide deformylase [Tamlana sedimentorum]|uniref:Peptide deformylase n=1 Tax=Neotamlana sedimentorum TaxID=1435349 RepID=A0A0D7WD97_9FLAO|nr:peptide deformylase [Tamlana sedimentorum]KJD37140.1 peptide deformylase [Tamlana sedimentorum]
MKTTYATICLVLILASCSIAKSSVKNAFSNKELKLIKAADGNAPMRVYKITNKTDSLLLRKKSSYINPEPKNAALQLFAQRLYATVTDSASLGVGIAAPQVGILKNIIWVQRLDKQNLPFEVYLNPKIVGYSKEKQTVTEGCLSIPDRRETLNSRSQIIDIEYDTLEGEHKAETIKGFTAVIFQHEIDHLNGILYLDHLTEEIEDSKLKP